MQDRIDRRTHKRIPVLVSANLATNLPLLRETGVTLHHLKRERRIHNPPIRRQALQHRRLRQALHGELRRNQHNRAHARVVLRHRHIGRPGRIALELVHGLRVKHAPLVLGHLMHRDIRELSPRISRPRIRLMHRQGPHKHARLIIRRKRQQVPIPVPRDLLIER